MDFSDSFRIVNLVVAVLLVLGGATQFFGNAFGFQHFIVGIYSILFGAAIALLEFRIPPQVARYASFLFSFIGRGIFYILAGTLLMNDDWWRIVPGAVVAVVGVGYAILEFIPSIEPPSNMREADNGWGAEQV